jgi:hypothetical protein
MSSKRSLTHHLSAEAFCVFKPWQVLAKRKQSSLGLRRAQEPTRQFW